MRKSRRAKFDDYSATQINTAIDEWVHSEVDRAVMRYWLNDALPYERIADIIGISAKTVQRIIDRHELKVFRHM